VSLSFWITFRDRLAGGRHRIERASSTVVEVGGLNEQHALSVGACSRDSLGHLQVHLRTQVARQAGYIGEARVLRQKEKHATPHHPVRLRIANQAIDHL
jgi:hypothetical protein